MSRSPTRDELASAYGATVADLVGPDLRVLLCGINPSLWSGLVGYHFARPTNRLWPTLAESGLTPRRLHPSETGELLAAGIGVTNLVARSTARADELTGAEMRAGVDHLHALVAQWRPRWVAVLGLSAYRTAFDDRHAGVGRQPDLCAGVGMWLLPNPSGLNAHYQQRQLTAAYRELREASDTEVIAVQ